MFCCCSVPAGCDEEDGVYSKTKKLHCSALLTCSSLSVRPAPSRVTTFVRSRVLPQIGRGFGASFSPSPPSSLLRWAQMSSVADDERENQTSHSAERKERSFKTMPRHTHRASVARYIGSTIAVRRLQSPPTSKSNH